MLNLFVGFFKYIIHILFISFGKRKYKLLKTLNEKFYKPKYRDSRYYK